MRRVSTTVLVVSGVLVALVLAGIVSFYASSSPDGLNRVAEDKGFSATQKQHATSDGPFAGYGTKGIADARLSGGLAGVAGVVTVLVLASGLAFAVRRRGSQAGEKQDTTATAERS